MTDHHPLDSVSQAQIAALGDLAGRLDRSSIQYWLFGGWAVDFYAGRVTRVHDDIDLAIWLPDLARIRLLLEGASWRHAPDDDEDGGTAFESDSVRLELTYLSKDDSGRIFTPLAEGSAYWSPEAFGNTRRELSGVPVRTLEFAALRSSKATARPEPEDAAKDYADSHVLAEIAPDDKVQ